MFIQLKYQISKLPHQQYLTILIPWAVNHFFLTNYTNLSNLNVSGITKLNGATTCMGTLNVQGNIIGSGSALTN